MNENTLIVRLTDTTSNNLFIDIERSINSKSVLIAIYVILLLQHELLFILILLLIIDNYDEIMPELFFAH